MLCQPLQAPYMYNFQLLAVVSTKHGAVLAGHKASNCPNTSADTFLLHYRKAGI